MRPLALLLAAALMPNAIATADEPIGRLQVVSPKKIDIIATAINGRGDIVGFEWIEEEARPGVVAQVPFFARGEEITYLPTLEGYTATFPADVSDGGLVVGRASKPIHPGVPSFLRNQAFLWESEGGMKGLGVLEGDNTSFASGISRDGRRISGFSVGSDRIRACVWDRRGDGWRAEALPHDDRLGSNVVAISDNGRNIAAVDGVMPCLWSRDEDGPWRRTILGDPGSLIPRAVNDVGTVVGLISTPDGQTLAVVWSRQDGLQQIAPPTGYVRAEALDVNNAGVVVGMVDGPNGSEIGPRAFAFEEGRLRLIDEGGPAFNSATAINDRGQVAGVLEEAEEVEIRGDR